MVRSILLGMVLAFVCALTAGENLVQDGDFERGLEGWRPLWSRDSVGTATRDRDVRHSGRQATSCAHPGDRDWSLTQQRWLDVQPGQIYELTGWVRLRGEGSTTLGVTLRDRNQDVTEWTFAGRTARASDEWQRLHSRFVAPRGTAAVQARVTGNGPAAVWLDDVSLERTGTLDGLHAGELPGSLTIANAMLEVTFRSADATFAVTDHRGGAAWRQRPGGPLSVLEVRQAGDGLHLALLDPASVLRIAAVVRLEPERPELVVSLSSDGELSGAVEFPLPFVSQQGMNLILPVNEGIAYPADDATLEPMRYHLYGGHGLCMPWYGLTDGRRGVMAIVETPDDASVGVPRLDSLLHLAPQWVSQKGRFGPPRRVRYAFFNDGGYVAMAKRYRRYAQDSGLLKTLADKRAENPNVNLLVGAVNVWCWERDAVALVREMQAAGIRRILWSNRPTPDALAGR